MNEPRTDPTLALIQGPGVRSVGQRELLRAMHELQIQQAQLEVQSEALRRTQAELSELHSRYFELYELAPVGYATLDPEGVFETANLTLTKMLGRHRRSLVGTKLSDRMRPGERPRFEAFLAGALHAPFGTHTTEITLISAQGPIPVMLEAVPSHQGETFVRLAVVDLTAAKRAEERLHEHEGRLAAVLESVPDGILTVSPDGQIESCNGAAARLLHGGRARLVGLPIQRVIPSFEELVGRERSEAVVKRGDGTFFVAEVAITSSATRFVAVITDITERKRRQAEHEEALARFELMAEHIDDGIFFAEAESYRALYLSPGFQKIFGRNAQEIEAAWPLIDWVHEDDRERVVKAATELAAGKPLDVQYRIVRPDGSFRTLNCRAFSIPGRSRLTGIVHDLTEELALQAELRQAQRLEAIGTLASGIAHDFNNLLMGVGGCLQLAMRRIEATNGAHPYLRRGVDAIVRGANLTKQILRFADTRPSDEEPIELDTVIAGSRDLIRSLVGDQVSVCILTGAPGLCVAADPGDIEQVLLNLASNARDAMPNGGVLALRTEPLQGGKVALSVRDVGVGMNAETQRRVFEPFYTTKEVGKGTGLGLSTVFAVVRRMGGSIHLDSAPGKGTTFTLNLPVVVPHGVVAMTDAEPARGEGQTILIVDDDALIRLTVETFVESLGYRALTAGSVADALRLYSENPRVIDVVLTDIMMPGLLGSDLARMVEKRAPEISVIFMSAHPLHELVRQGHVSKTAQWLAKPFDTGGLAAALQRALRIRADSAPPPSLRVFVVDDDADVLNALRDVLEMEGHSIGIAGTASRALEEIPTFSPDIVLCDISLDDSMNGLELVARLRRDERLEKTVFLAVTGMAPAQVRSAAADAGFADVLTKPLDFNGLTQLLVSRAGR